MRGSQERESLQKEVYENVPENWTPITITKSLYKIKSNIDLKQDLISRVTFDEKNPAYGRQSISRKMRIVASIPQ